MNSKLYSLMAVAAATGAIFLTPVPKTLICLIQGNGVQGSRQLAVQECSGCKVKFAQTGNEVSTPRLEEIDSPEDRIDQKLVEVETTLVELKKDPAILQVVKMESILVPGENGKFFKLKFNADGYVSEMSDESGSIRFHKPGFSIYGFDIKCPAQGFTDYTTVLSTTSDLKGNILTGTLNLTGDTWSVPVPGTVANAGANNGVNQGIWAGHENQMQTTAKQRLNSCIRGCDSIRNADSRQNKTDREKCLAEANAAFDNCIMRLTGVAVTWGIGGAGVGAAVAAAPTVGVGIGFGATVGFLTGYITGGTLHIIECHTSKSTAVNLCNKTYEINRNDLIADHKACTSGCYATYNDETRPR
jgi:hypothetical protein